MRGISYFSSSHWGFIICLLNDNTWQCPSILNQNFKSRERCPYKKFHDTTSFWWGRKSAKLCFWVSLLSGNLHHWLNFCSLSQLKAFSVMATIYLARMTLQCPSALLRNSNEGEMCYLPAVESPSGLWMKAIIWFESVWLALWAGSIWTADSVLYLGRRC